MSFLLFTDRLFVPCSQEPGKSVGLEMNAPSRASLHPSPRNRHRRHLRRLPARRLRSLLLRRSQLFYRGCDGRPG